MRNLKKLLSLVLALALMFSLTIVSASALTEDFTDGDKVTHKEAVDVLTELGVLSGYPDGTFQGDKIITRAELCKIIAVALNGGKDPILNANAPSMFADCPATYWANAYIAYCVNLGIIHGDQGVGGPFRPDDPVTIVEAAKAMLVATGLRAEVAKLTGADWLINVTIKANACDPKLFDGLIGVGVQDSATRDNAAQMLFNMIQTNMQTYDNVIVSDGKGSFVTEARQGNFSRQINGTDTPWTILQYYFGVYRATGVVQANEYAGLGTEDAQVEGKTIIDVNGTCEWAGMHGTGNTLFVVSSGREQLGMEVDVYAKQVTPNNNVFGATIPTARNTTTMIESNQLVYDTARAAGLTVDVTTGNATPLYFNVDDDSLNAAAYYDAARVWAGSATGTGTNANIRAERGSYVKVIDNNGDKKADMMLVEMPTMMSISNVTATNASFRGETAPFDLKDIVADFTLVRDQLVLCTEIDGIRYLEEPATVQATVLGIESGNEKLSLSDGKIYSSSFVQNLTQVENYTANKFSKNTFIKGTGTASNADGVVGTVGVDFNTTYLFYLDPAGNIACYKEVEAGIPPYILVTQAGTDSAALSDSVGKIFGYLSDGSAGQAFTVNLKSKSNGAVSNEAVAGVTRFDSVFVSSSGTAGAAQLIVKGDYPVLCRYTLDSAGVITLYDPVMVTDNTISAPFVYTAANSTAYTGIKNATTIHLDAANQMVNAGAITNATINSKSVIFYLTRTLNTLGTDLTEYKFQSVGMGAAAMAKIEAAKIADGAAIIDATNVVKAMCVISTYPLAAGTVQYAYVWTNSRAENADSVYTYSVILPGATEGTTLKSKDDIGIGFYTVTTDSNGFSTFTSVGTGDSVTAIRGAVVDTNKNNTITFPTTSGAQSGSAVGKISANYTSDLTIFRVDGPTLKADGVFSNINTDHTAVPPKAVATVQLLVNDDNQVIIAVSSIHAGSN